MFLFFLGGVLKTLWRIILPFVIIGLLVGILVMVIQHVLREREMRKAAKEQSRDLISAIAISKES